jgi:hypothetical protein
VRVSVQDHSNHHDRRWPLWCSIVSELSQERSYLNLGELSGRQIRMLCDGYVEAIPSWLWMTKIIYGLTALDVTHNIHPMHNLSDMIHSFNYS